MKNLGTNEILLGGDICAQNNQKFDISNITNQQVSILLSMTGCGIRPEDRNEKRAWRVPNKGKHGGFLRLQTVGKRFFSSEK